MSAHHIDGAVLITKRVTKSSFRREIINSWDGSCAYCGCQPEKITLDHVIPKARGGTTERSNLVPACAPCNVAKNHCEVWGWYEAQPFFDAERADRIKSWMAGR